MALRPSLAGWVLAAALAACASPTLPLPPPAVPTITPAATGGRYHLFSERGAEPNAIIIVYNRNPNVPRDQRVGGAQADGSGTWDADVIASPGDFLDVLQEFGATRSPSVLVQVPR